MKRIPVLFAAAMLCAAPAFAAGQMESVTQTIELHHAQITSSPSSSGAGGGGSLGYKGFSASGGGGKQAGEITVGRISNDGGSMKNVTQTIKGNHANINSQGAAISIGEIENK